MKKSRLEAFSDGVFAIILTIMVIELKVPHGANWQDLIAIVPAFLSYLLSFIYIGIYWNNHHHLLQLAKEVSGSVLWANLHLLFWLSLTPFATAWAGENHFEPAPVAIYGFVLMMSGIAYYILTRRLIRVEQGGSVLEKAVGQDKKGVASVILYALAIVFSFMSPLISCAIYVGVAVMWIIPDRRIENMVH